MLWKGDALLQVGARALAILDALTEAPGRLVSKRELRERAWPDGGVDDANLKVQISALRKALRGCEGLIRAEASLGYRFLGEAAPADPPPDTQGRRVLLPPLTTEPIGREEVVAGIVRLLEDNRLVTVLGPGGVGKTTVALAVAHRLADTFADGTCFIDLNRIARDGELHEAVARALDIPVGEGRGLEQIQAALQERRSLLVIDSCEHVADAVASLVEHVLSVSNENRVLVTSRESLNVGAEFVWRLEPLAVPPSSLSDTAANAANYSAVQLFTRIATAASEEFTFDDESAPAIVELCRRLDGLPLAIEMTASMAGTFDIGEIGRSLDQHFSSLDVDRRAANPGQRSLFSTIDFSYHLLPRQEQAVLRRLALLAGAFTLDAAVVAAADNATSASAIREAIVALANKSLLVVDHRANPPEYHLLEAIRAYAASREGEHATGQRDRS